MNDEELFQHAMKDVQPLSSHTRRQGRSAPRHKSPLSLPHAPTQGAVASPLTMDEVIQLAAESDERFEELMNPPVQVIQVSTGLQARPDSDFYEPRNNASSGVRPLVMGNLADLDRRTASRLKRGKLKADIVLDLHGQNRDTAHAHVSAAIKQAFHAQARVVLIITGKGSRSQSGQGVLRESLKGWLNARELRPLILAWCSAQPHDGGEGAFYCLLKRQRHR